MKKYKIVFIIILSLYLVTFIVLGKEYINSSTDVDSTTSDIVIKDKGSKSKKIALTFDDGPNEKYTEIILDGLKERNVEATFFLIGKNIEGNEELVKRMQDEGHLVGNHSYSHINFDKVSRNKALIDINKNNRLIYSITGEKVKYIRPPFGNWNESLNRITGLNVIMWDIDPKDWCTFDTEYIVRHVINRADDGHIILLHDSYDTSAEATMYIVDYLKSEGYEFVTIDELLED